MTPRITDSERRARLVDRHRLRRAGGDVVDAVRSVVAMHSSDPASPYLAMWARVAEFRVADLQRALYTDRSLWRLHAMRRTLFVVPTDEAAIFDAGAGRAIALKERQRLEQWLEPELGSGRASGWLGAVESSVMEIMADGVERRTADLSAVVPELGTEITVRSGKWSGRVPVSSRLLYILGMEQKLVRAHPAGTWRSSQYHWVASRRWFDDLAGELDPGTGRTELLSRYLTTHGPARMADLRWWTGWTVRQVGAALAAIGATAVELDGGDEGFVRAGDLESPQPDGPAVALLPGLDSSPMGWKERDWFLGNHVKDLYDRNGNVGPTVWADGRIVGGWGQRPDGEVAYRILEDVGTLATDLIDAETAKVEAWLAGTVVIPRFRTPLERELSS